MTVSTPRPGYRLRYEQCACRCSKLAAGTSLTVFGLTKAGRFTITVIGLTTAFPVMAAATALVAVAALIRKLSQPLYPARRTLK